MLVPNLIVINYPKPTSGANALTEGHEDINVGVAYNPAVMMETSTSV
jgi:hypothetical protein